MQHASSHKLATLWWHSGNNEKDNMSALKKKSETCEEQLRRMCKDIADSITSPEDETQRHDLMKKHVRIVSGGP